MEIQQTPMKKGSNISNRDQPHWCCGTAQAFFFFALPATMMRKKMVQFKSVSYDSLNRAPPPTIATFMRNNL